MDTKEIKFAYENGGTLRSISLFFGININSVRHALRKENVTLRRRGYAAATAARCPHCGEVLTAADLRRGNGVGH
jgi:DNA-binding CsgD family transcriptional regulator